MKTPEINTLTTDVVFRLDTLNRRWSNASLLVHRSFDGHIVCTRQSGTHWVKNMLSSALIQQYNLPPLTRIRHHQTGMAHEAEKMQVSQWLRDANAAIAAQRA